MCGWLPNVANYQQAVGETQGRQYTVSKKIRQVCFHETSTCIFHLVILHVQGEKDIGSKYRDTDADLFMFTISGVQLVRFVMHRVEYSSKSRQLTFAFLKLWDLKVVYRNKEPESYHRPTVMGRALFTPWQSVNCRGYGN